MNSTTPTQSTTAVHEVTVEPIDQFGSVMIRGAVADDDGTIRILDRHGYERHYAPIDRTHLDNDGVACVVAQYIGGIDTSDPRGEFEWARGREPGGFADRYRDYMILMGSGMDERRINALLLGSEEPSVEVVNRLLHGETAPARTVRRRVDGEEIERQYALADLN